MDKRAILRSIPNMNELLEDKKIREFQERIGSEQLKKSDSECFGTGTF